MTRLPSRTVVVALVAVLVVSSGCTLLPGADGDDSGPIGTDARESYAAVDGFTAVMETTTTQGNETDHMVARVKIRPGGNKVRQRVLEPDSQAGNVYVSNGSVFWTYNASENTVTRTEFDRSNGTREYGAFLQRIFNTINDDRATAEDERTRTVGVSALPVVPQGGSAKGAGVSPGGTLEEYNVTYRGTEPVDGRTAHVVHLTPRPSHEGVAGNQTLWIDTEHYVPLKVHQSITINGDHVESTMVYRNVTINPGLSPETFQFDPPENATVEESQVSSNEYDSLSAAADDANFSAPDPDLPAGFELDRATVTRTRNVTSLVAQYSNGTVDFMVTKQAGNLTGRQPPSDRTNVTVAGQDGYYDEFGSTGIVSWQCDGHGYAVTGEFPKERLLAIAESVGCA